MGAMPTLTWACRCAATVRMLTASVGTTLPTFGNLLGNHEKPCSRGPRVGGSAGDCLGRVDRPPKPSCGAKEKRPAPSWGGRVRTADAHLEPCRPRGCQSMRLTWHRPSRRGQQPARRRWSCSSYGNDERGGSSLRRRPTPWPRSSTQHKQQRTSSSQDLPKKPRLPTPTRWGKCPKACCHPIGSVPTVNRLSCGGCNASLVPGAKRRVAELVRVYSAFNSEWPSASVAHGPNQC